MWRWFACFSAAPSVPESVTTPSSAPPVAFAPLLPPGTLTYAETTEVRGLCEAQDLTVQLTHSGQPTKELRFPGSCSGPYTELAQQEAQQASAELRKRYEAGELTLSELDYDITTGYTLSSSIVEEFELDGRPGLLVSHPFLQPHAGMGARYQVLGDLCGGLFASEVFGTRYGHDWQRVELETSGTQLTVTGWLGDSAEVLYRLDASRCPRTLPDP